jgi:hypothetical protein
MWFQPSSAGTQADNSGSDPIYTTMGHCGTLRASFSRFFSKMPLHAQLLLPPLRRCEVLRGWEEMVSQLSDAAQHFTGMCAYYNVYAVKIVVQFRDVISGRGYQTVNSYSCTLLSSSWIRSVFLFDLLSYCSSDIPCNLIHHFKRSLFMQGLACMNSLLVLFEFNLYQLCNTSGLRPAVLSLALATATVPAARN